MGNEIFQRKMFLNARIRARMDPMVNRGQAVDVVFKVTLNPTAVFYLFRYVIEENVIITLILGRRIQVGFTR